MGRDSAREQADRSCGRFEVSDRARFERGCDFIEAVQMESQRAFVEFVPIWVMDAMHGYVGHKLQDRWRSEWF